MIIKKPCPICEEGIKIIDYKDVVLLRRFLTKFNKIVPRYYSGTCLKHQKDIANGIKRARIAALLPFVLSTKR
ncbi:MAG: 30S ribosomal protein S18 [Candidatus Gracilibacteria bacterium]|nr:30S ribosomal protein S18 [Candidatus Gracilibacteria bacterium]